MHVCIDGDLLGPSERISTMGLMAINHVPTFWTIANNYGGVSIHGGTPIAGWFIML